MDILTTLIILVISLIIIDIGVLISACKITLSFAEYERDNTFIHIIIVVIFALVLGIIALSLAIYELTNMVI